MLHHKTHEHRVWNCFVRVTNWHERFPTVAFQSLASHAAVGCRVPTQTPADLVAEASRERARAPCEFHFSERRSGTELSAAGLRASLWHSGSQLEPTACGGGLRSPLPVPKRLKTMAPASALLS
ncbi:serine/threonine-protein phosphatase 2A 55 kDa regulatory subunit B delta isoform isoform X1 [Pteropus vampyrus]|uniref:Serine/threonine-protein phosphatase 2A 55 kDa regulatory subunit B delta isoform isoform X1 n=1 Tax=Pteropus vampyrus TaxID=132908 RepID=A0A6P6D2P4_PTEVA|nr:serine/threonine-protein phosphatase 2A 55 kDa regulatory subunit B delta isoform isoform X1 [Pteropus vampyrus]